MNNITTKLNRNQPIMIVQWDCRSIRSKFPELQKKSQNIDVIILSETWLDEAENVYLKGFDVVRRQKRKIRRWCCHFINNKQKY
jgi:hypothetical protein